MGEENENTKLKSVDEGLNDLILRKYDKAIDYYSSGKYEECYNLLKSLFYLIKPYEFEKKADIQMVIDSIEDHKKQNTGVNGKAAIIMMNNKKFMFSALVDNLYRELPQAFAGLGKWMAIVRQHNDLDAQISEEVFNTNVSLIEEKRKELSELPGEKILKLMSNNMVNAAHSRFLISQGE